MCFPNKVLSLAVSHPKNSVYLHHGLTWLVVACFLSDELIGVYTVFAQDTLDGIRDDDGMKVALKYKSP